LPHVTNNSLRPLPAVATSHDPVPFAIAQAFGKVCAPKKVVALIGGTPEDRATAAASAPIHHLSSNGNGGSAYQLDVAKLFHETAAEQGSRDDALSTVAGIVHSFHDGQETSLLVIESFEKLLETRSPYVLAFTNLPSNLRVVAGVPEPEREKFELGLQQTPALRGRFHRVEMDWLAEVQSWLEID
jgi:hypothetical protein